MRILIPTDFSKLSDFATIFADKLKAIEAVEIHFLHVVEWGETEFDATGNPVAGEGEDALFLAQRISSARQKMNQLAEARAGNDAFHIQFGPRTKTIVKYAETNHFDLIVMGTKGAQGLSRWLSGSETQHIARQSQIPVLSLMCDRSDLDIKDILIVHDFMNQESVKLPLLKILESGFNATVHLLYVMTQNKPEEQIEAKMNEFAKINELKRTEVHIHIDRDVSSGITHFNQMNDMDLIVVGTEGRRGLGRLLKSSVAENLINNLYKPIITYHLK